MSTVLVELFTKKECPKNGPLKQDDILDFIQKDQTILIVLLYLIC